jgi:nucleotidyltransferase substrate binding protein (TIGR01987 family)
MNKELRWRQRFQNLEKAFEVFQRRIAEYEKDRDSEAFQMALIQSFKMLLELSWKTLKDYLENEGIIATAPKAALREAFRAEIIGNGEEWMEALERRNLTGHTYDNETAREVLAFIDERFQPIVRDLYHRLKQEI